jgi:hypothetical protein
MCAPGALDASSGRILRPEKLNLFPSRTCNRLPDALQIVVDIGIKKTQNPNPTRAYCCIAIIVGSLSPGAVMDVAVEFDCQIDVRGKEINCKGTNSKLAAKLAP